MAITVIAGRLGVSKSSVSLWVRDIELTPAQHEALRAANPIYNRQTRGQRSRSESARQVRAGWQDEGRRAARRGDPIHRTGCMLYWAEGSKRRNALILTNSDPDLLRVFADFLRNCFGVPDERVALSVDVHLGNGLTIDEVHGYWLEQLALPSSCLRKPRTPAASSDPLRRRKLPYGTARIAVSSTRLAQHVYGAIQEYGGFERPEWLG